MFVFGLVTEIFWTVYCLIVHLAFLTSHTVYCLSACAKPLKKQYFRFSVIFPRKTVQVLIFKVEYLENGLADLNDFGLILQDFERPFR